MRDHSKAPIAGLESAAVNERANNQVHEMLYLFIKRQKPDRKMRRIKEKSVGEISVTLYVWVEYFAV